MCLFVCVCGECKPTNAICLAVGVGANDDDDVSELSDDITVEISRVDTTVDICVFVRREKW